MNLLTRLLAVLLAMMAVQTFEFGLMLLLRLNVDNMSMASI